MADLQTERKQLRPISSWEEVENSRNRVFVEDGQGIRTQAFDPSNWWIPVLLSMRRYVYWAIKPS